MFFFLYISPVLHPAPLKGHVPSADLGDSAPDPPRQRGSGPDAERFSPAGHTAAWPSTSPSAGGPPPPPASAPGGNGLYCEIAQNIYTNS